MTDSKGILNILPEDIWKWQYLEKIVHNTMDYHDFKEIRTSILQPAEFLEKTLYHLDQLKNTTNTRKFFYELVGNEGYVLSPDGTINVLNSLIVDQSLKKTQRTYYMGSFFSKDTGFESQHKIGAEILGIKEVFSDIEAITLGLRLLNEFGFESITIEMNSYGCPDCRPKYIEELIKFIEVNKKNFCEDCLKEIEENNRLNSSCINDKCKELNKNAPNIMDYLCDNCKENFNSVQRMLSNLMINYRVNSQYESFFSYYTRTVFRYLLNIGDQKIDLGGGGRYDILARTLTGKDVAAVGFSLKTKTILEWLGKLDLIVKNQERTKVLIYAKSHDLEIIMMQIIQELYDNYIHTTIGDCCSSEEEHEDLNSCSAVIILEEDSLKKGKVLFRNLHRGYDDYISLSEIVPNIKRIQKTILEN